MKKQRFIAVRNWSSEDIELGLEPEGDVRVLEKDHDCEIHSEDASELGDVELVIRDGHLSVFSSSRKELRNVTKRSGQ